MKTKNEIKEYMLSKINSWNEEYCYPSNIKYYFDKEYNKYESSKYKRLKEYDWSRVPYNVDNDVSIKGTTYQTSKPIADTGTDAQSIIIVYITVAGVTIIKVYHREVRFQKYKQLFDGMEGIRSFKKVDSQISPQDIDWNRKIRYLTPDEFTEEFLLDIM